MKGLLKRILSSRSTVDSVELKRALREVEQDRRRVRIAVRRWERRRRQTMEKLKGARKAGNALEVDYLWEELKEHRELGADLRREARASNIEGLALRRYLRALEQLEHRHDRAGARRLLERIRETGLSERMDYEREAEVRCLSEVERVLEEFTGGDLERREDPEKILFLTELDGLLSEDEEEGEETRRREDELLERFQQSEPEPESGQ